MRASRTERLERVGEARNGSAAWKAEEDVELGRVGARVDQMGELRVELLQQNRSRRNRELLLHVRDERGEIAAALVVVQSARDERVEQRGEPAPQDGLPQFEGARRGEIGFGESHDCGDGNAFSF